MASNFSRLLRFVSIRSSDRIDSNRQHFHCPPSKSRSTIFSKSRANRLPACRLDRRGNDEGIGFTNRFPVCRIANIKDESALVVVKTSLVYTLFEGFELICIYETSCGRRCHAFSRVLKTWDHGSLVFLYGFKIVTST